MKNHESTIRDAAMLALQLTRAAFRRDPHFLMHEVAGKMIEEQGMSRATAYRYVRSAIDFLGIAYDNDPERNKKRRERVGEGLNNARAYGWQNGAPGRERRSI